MNLDKITATIQSQEKDDVSETVMTIIPRTNEVSLSDSNGVSYTRSGDSSLQILYPSGKAEELNHSPLPFHNSLKLFYHESLRIWGRDGLHYSGDLCIDEVQIRETRLSDGSLFQDPVGRAWLHRNEYPEIKAVCEVDAHYGLRLFAEFDPDGTIRRKYLVRKITYDDKLYDADLAPEGFPFPGPATLREE